MTGTPLSKGQLTRMALTRFVAGVAIVAAILFIPAGTLDYWQAWLYLAVLFTPVAAAFTWLVTRHPDLLERRLRGREKRARESWIIRAGLVVYVLAFVVPGFDHRFGWSHVPDPVVIAADVVLLVGYALFIWVLRANAFASRIIEVEQGQRVVASGPYAVVRHPMYVSNLLIFLSSPIALGSWWALIPALPLIPVLVARILDEEHLLADELPGYREYMRATRYRLVPGMW